jgi:hypothetical protein
VCDGARGEVRARKVASTASGEVGRDRGDGAASRRSLARRHGRRRARRPRLAGVYVTVHGVVFRASQNATCYPLATVRAFKSTATRPSRARRRRGEHGGIGDHGGARKRGPRPSLALTAAAHACWGARLRALWLARARARGHARVANATRRSVTARRRRTVAASYGKGGKAKRRRARRRRQRHLQKTASQPGSKAGITSGGAAVRGNSAFLLGLKVGASTWGGKRSSSPRWPQAVVQASV